MVWLKKTVEKFAYKEAEIHITEWNSSPSCRDYVHDTAFMAPFIIQNNIRSIGLADSIGFWDITDIFEESGANQSIFHGGFGLLNVQGLEKPSYHGYWFLSRLGGEILDKGESYIVTRKDDRIQVLMWNYCHYNEVFAKGDSSGLKKYDRYSIFEDKKDIDFRINVDNLKGNYRIIKYVFDRQNGSVYDSWIANGAPENPDKEELEILRSNMKPKGSICYIQGSSINTDISIKPHGVVFIELSKVY